MRNRAVILRLMEIYGGGLMVDHYNVMQREREREGAEALSTSAIFLLLLKLFSTSCSHHFKCKLIMRGTK